MFPEQSDHKLDVDGTIKRKFPIEKFVNITAAATTLGTAFFAVRFDIEDTTVQFAILLAALGILAALSGWHLDRACKKHDRQTDDLRLAEYLKRTGVE